MSRRRRLGITVVLLSTLAAPVVVSLCTRVRHVLETPLPADARPGQPVAMEFAYSDQADRPGRHVGRLRLYQRDPTMLVRHDELHVLAATYDTHPQLVDGRLAIAGTECAYRTLPGEQLLNNNYFRLVREPACAPLHGNPTGELELALTFDGTGRLAVWGSVPTTPDSDPSTIYIGHAGSPGPAVYGFYADAAGAGVRRIELLAYLWQIRPTAAWIWIALSLAFAVAFAGASIFPLGPVTDEVRPTWSSGLGAWCFAAALGIVYAALIPPFQTPDEPDHLLSFAQANHRPDVAEQAATWARLMHFDRIRADARQHFRVTDIDRPAAIPWGDYVFPEDVVARSSTTERWWAAIARLLGTRRVPMTLLTVRLANAALFSLAVGAGTALVVAIAPIASYPQLTCFTFFLVPTLAFFAMQMSEFAIVTSSSVLLACGLLAHFVDAPRGRGNGLLLSAASGVMFASGRGTLPMAPLVAAPLVARVALAALTGVPSSVRDTIRFWAGAAAFAPFLLVLTGARYREAIVRLSAERVPAIFQRVLDHVWIELVVATVLLAVAAAVVEIAARALARREHAISRWTVIAIRVVYWSVAASVVVSLIVSWSSATLPHAGSIEGSAFPATSGVYVESVFRTMATTFRLREPDFYLSSSFWCGFGWLEMPFDDRYVVALTTACALAAVVLFIDLGRRADGARLIWLVCFAAGWAASLYALVLSAHSLQRSLHGRYLIPLYLCMLVILWSAAVLRPSKPDSRRWRVAVLLTACATVHASVLPLILERYFGR